MPQPNLAPPAAASARAGPPTTMSHTLVTFHAHPDDEALLTAGVMAKAADAGHRVVAVFATDGEAGDADPAAFGAGGRSAGQRRAEAEAAAAVLGRRPGGVPRLRRQRVRPPTASRPVGAVLGRAGRRGRRAPGRRAAGGATPTCSRSTTGYGGYGHPDHVQVHRVGLRAAELAGTPVVLEATVSRELLGAGAELAASLGYELGTSFRPGRARPLVPARGRDHHGRRRDRPARPQAGGHAGPRQPGHEREGVDTCGAWPCSPRCPTTCSPSPSPRSGTCAGARRPATPRRRRVRRPGMSTPDAPRRSRARTSCHERAPERRSSRRQAQVAAAVGDRDRRCPSRSSVAMFVVVLPRVTGSTLLGGLGGPRQARALAGPAADGRLAGQHGHLHRRADELAARAHPSAGVRGQPGVERGVERAALRRRGRRGGDLPDVRLVGLHR